MKHVIKTFIFLICALLIKPNAIAQTFDFSQVTSTGQRLYYDIRDGNSVEITFPNDDLDDDDPYWGNYTRPGGAMVIPATVTHDGTTYSVTRICGYDFRSCSALTSVVIPNTVTEIGTEAFAYCTGITSLTIGQSVVSIGNLAFTYCSALSSVVFNADSCCNGVSNAFPSNITSITLGNNVRAIPSGMFSGQNLASVVIPSSVTYISTGAFSRNSIQSIVNGTVMCNDYFNIL